MYESTPVYVVGPLYEQFWPYLCWWQFLVAMLGGLVWLNYNVAFALIGLFFVGQEQSALDKSRFNLFFMIVGISLLLDIAWVAWYSQGLTTYSQSLISYDTNMFILSWVANVVHLLGKILFLYWLNLIRTTGNGVFLSETLRKQSYTPAKQSEDSVQSHTLETNEKEKQEDKRAATKSTKK